MASIELRSVVAVMAGSALGGGARFVIQTFVGRVSTTPLPVATIAINIVGSFLLAFIMQVPALSTSTAATTRLFLTTGVLGGFTTYSSFNFETIKLLQDGHVGHAVANVGITLVCCLVGGLLAVLLGRAIS